MSITDDNIVKNVNVKVTLHYGSESQTEIWLFGPHAAAGVVLDALMGLTGAGEEITSVTVVPNPTDMPDE